MMTVCALQCFQMSSPSVSSVAGAPPLSPSPPHTPPPPPESRCSHRVGFHHSLPIDTLITVGHIQKIVLLMVVLIQLAHGSASGRNSVVDKEE